jgi:NAD-dependent SIR2 family protein deacetylase
LEPCIQCRRRITPNQKSYQYTDRNYIVNALCELCYDKSGLDIQKKYQLVEPKTVNYEEILDQNPEKIKELTNLK